MKKCIEHALLKSLSHTNTYIDRAILSSLTMTLNNIESLTKVGYSPVLNFKVILN